MDPAAIDTIRQLVSALHGVLPVLQEATASQPVPTTVPTASQPAVAADSTAAACPSLNPEVTYLTGPIATPSSYSVHALLDSGSAGNFISAYLCHQLGLKKSPNPVHYRIHSIP
ncbi:hypothetical protein KOW79_003225 [Hemibagrus wyckioides]|uniref:Uncharacterized protein n=1 Tax=Hemibagrus wyckioides TaxID=337641 RepID=A0A9D3P4Y4_9TELE|nr:hypothetical protein KOW79_003225 [Hemibagrus wyckioides]